MASYNVSFDTLDDTSARGGKRGPASRTFYVDAKSAKGAVEAAYPKLTELIAQGYCKVDDALGVNGQVERDTYRGAAYKQVAGSRSTFGVRRGGQFSQPTWSFVFIVHTGPLRWETVLTKVQ